MLLCGIIKPHAVRQSAEILTALEACSVMVKEKKPICLTHELVEILYDHMSPSARCEIGRQLIGHEGIAVLLEVASVERLLEIVGRESDPAQCAPETIRARFGVHNPPAYVGDDFWWENAFHRPIDAREATRDLFHIFNLTLQNH